jgi:DNA-binding NarL/FixJ family response regulator
VLSTHDAQAFIEAAFEAGAAGVVLKRDLASELLNAVDAVLGGRRYPPASLLPQGSHRPGKVIARDVEVSQTVNNQNKTKGMNTT